MHSRPGSSSIRGSFWVQVEPVQIAANLGPEGARVKKKCRVFLAGGVCPGLSPWIKLALIAAPVVASYLPTVAVSLADIKLPAGVSGNGPTIAAALGIPLALLGLD